MSYRCIHCDHILPPGRILAENDGMCLECGKNTQYEHPGFLPGDFDGMPMVDEDFAYGVDHDIVDYGAYWD